LDFSLATPLFGPFQHLFASLEVFPAEDMLQRNWNENDDIQRNNNEEVPYNVGSSMSICIDHNGTVIPSVHPVVTRHDQVFARSRAIESWCRTHLLAKTEELSNPSWNGIARVQKGTERLV